MIKLASGAGLILSVPRPSHVIWQLSGAVEVSDDKIVTWSSRRALIFVGEAGPVEFSTAFSARPKTSKPGPRLAEELGTLILNSDITTYAYHESADDFFLATSEGKRRYQETD